MQPWYPATKEDEERRKKALEKAMSHEQSFVKKSENDVIMKRMGSDLFKGGQQK